MTTRPHASAYPEAGIQDAEESRPVGGLTKREYFAAMAIAGKADRQGDDYARVAQQAVICADALLEALNKSEAK